MDILALFESILREKKDHLIRKLDITKTTQDSIIEFFEKHPNLESKIEWQKKSHEVVSQINKLMQDTEYSRSKTKKKVKEGDLTVIWKDKNVKILFSSKEEILVVPLDHEACVFMDSFDCYGMGAKWCIGDRVHGEKHWKDYLKRKNVFMFYYTSRHNNKGMFQYNTKQNTVYLWEEEDRVLYEWSIDCFGYAGEKLNGEAPFAKCIDEALKIHEEQLWPKPDPKICEFLGKDYTDIEYGEAYAWAIQDWWEGIENLKQTQGIDMELIHEGAMQFTLKVNEPEFLIQFSSIRPNKFKHIKWMGHNKIIRSIHDVCVWELHEDPSYCTAKTTPMISKIDCPRLALTNIHKENYDDRECPFIFPDKLTGDLILGNCTIDSHIAKLLPKNIQGKVELIDTTFMPMYELYAWKEQLINNNEFITEFKTMIPGQIIQHIEKKYNEFWKGLIERTYFEERKIMYDKLIRTDIFHPRGVVGLTYDKVVNMYATEFIEHITKYDSEFSALIKSCNPESIMRIVKDLVEHTIREMMD